ncbi:MAG: DUF2948 family protein [Hyphomicrobiales bacterium]
MSASAFETGALANMSEFLKLSAFDAEDLDIVSAHMQDALVRVGDMKFVAGQGRFALIANRFDWLSAEGKEKGFRRRRTAVHFDRVLGVRSFKVKRTADDAVLELLSIEFMAGDLPSGKVALNFAGGGVIELDVECIDSGLSDLGPEWGTTSRPEHDDEGTDNEFRA